MGGILRAFLGAVVIGVAGCAPAPASATFSAPVLIRDTGQLFSAVARDKAEARLQSIGRRYGVWVMVLTDVKPDTPRVLDAPMAEARAKGLRAIALVLGAKGSVGQGYSGNVPTGLEFGGETAAADLVASGHADGGLDTFVESVERWFVLHPDGLPKE